jgi:hypothetical protein
MSTLADWLRAAYAGEESGCPPPEAYLEGELEGEASAEDRRRLDEHADRCPACASERELAQLFDAAPQGAGVRDEDVAFVASRLEAASPVRPAARVVAFPAAPAETPVRETRPRRSLQPVWRIAAALILVLAGVFLFRLTQSAPPARPPSCAGRKCREPRRTASVSWRWMTPCSGRRPSPLPRPGCRRRWPRGCTGLSSISGPSRRSTPLERRSRPRSPPVSGQNRRRNLVVRWKALRWSGPVFWS